jgi:hypothetical protein
VIEVERAITGHHDDDEGDLVAEISCATISMSVTARRSSSERR